MSITSKFSSKLANIFSTNDKKSSLSSQATAAAAEIEASQEKARKEILKLTKTSRIGFPFKPTCIAYDMVQKLVAIGTKYGHVKLYGGESIEYTIYHSQSFSISPSASLTQSTNLTLNSFQSNLSFPQAVLFMTFVINEGALITYCEDSTLFFWTLRQKQPGITYSKKLVNEKASCMYLPFQSNWLFVGTEKGNTYLLNIYNNFSQSGYDVKWNNVIELTQKTKPGKVIHLSEHPLDSSKLLIGFDSGLIALWNLKLKKAEMRFYGTAETLSSVSWFYDGKQFISSHNNGSLIVWNAKNDSKPTNIMHPHMNESDLIPRYNMIKKVSWESTKNGEPLLIFADGLPSNDCPIKDAITIIKNNKHKTIIEMKERIIDFIVISNSPWIDDNPSDPSAVIILLENNLIIIDLKSDGYPQFQHHHQINLHESPVNVCEYIVEPPKHLFNYLETYREKSLQHQDILNQQQQQHHINPIIGNATISNQIFSSLSYPINGGLKCSKANIFPYNELIVTGHEDGSIKIWDSSGLGLNLLYKLKTHKIFDKRRDTNSQIEIDLPYKITAISLNGTYLAVAALGGHVSLYKFNPKNYNPTDEELADIPLVEIPINYDYNHNNNNCSLAQNESNNNSNQTQGTSFYNNEYINKKELKCFLRTKIGFRKQNGFQPELVSLLYWSQRPPIVNIINIYTKSNLLLFGTDESIVGIDYLNRNILINMSIADFYIGNDHLNRFQRSPKKITKSGDVEETNNNEQHHTNFFIHKQSTVDNSHRDDISRSTSCSSLENLSLSEGVSFICINDYSKNKNEIHQTSQIWIGTTYGSVLLLNMTNTNTNSNTNENKQNAQTNQKYCNINATGIMHTLKGQIMNISILDINGNLISNQSSTLTKSSANDSSNLKDSINNEELEDIDFSYLNINQVSNSIADNFGSNEKASADSSSNGANSSPSPISTPTINSFVNPFSAQPPTSSSQTSSFDDPKPNSKSNKKVLSSQKSSKFDFSSLSDLPERNQFVVITSEAQIKVIALPSNNCIFKIMVTDGVIAKANVVVINYLSYLTCYLTNGSFNIYNLPNPTLKTNLDLNSQSIIVKEKDLMDRTLKTFVFSSRGHSLYMCSQSEIQKLYLSNLAGTTNLTDMLSEFFDPKISSPPPPKPNIFKSLFSNAPLDREELFGESSGKPSTCIVKNVDNESQKTRKELSELQKLALERGEKLNALEMKTEQMSVAASEFAKNAHNLANKYKNKKFF